MNTDHSSFTYEQYKALPAIAQFLASSLSPEQIFEFLKMVPEKFCDRLLEEFHDPVLTETVNRLVAKEAMSYVRRMNMTPAQTRQMAMNCFQELGFSSEDSAAMYQAWLQDALF